MVGDDGKRGEPLDLAPAPGEGGTAGECYTIGSKSGGNAPAVDEAGKSGHPLGHGQIGDKFGTLTSQGLYVPPLSGKGLAGSAATGGGGGGSGGGGACHDPVLCGSQFGGGGGGGGSGGCGGTGGEGGHGGGASIALLSVSSSVVIEDSRLAPRSGGRGGDGGDGGPGGDPGPGGKGSSGQRDGQGGICGGDGAEGAPGGRGGNGGGGAGGSGGPSVGIVYYGSQPVDMRTAFTPSSPAPRGSGGSNGVDRAPSGDEGISDRIRSASL